MIAQSAYPSNCEQLEDTFVLTDLLFNLVCVLSVMAGAVL